MLSGNRTRREVLQAGGRLLLAAPFVLSPIPAFAGQTGKSKPSTSSYSGTDAQLLDEIQQAAFRFFWEQAHPKTGFVKDRARTRGTDEYTVASIASTGFGLTALCIADTRGYKPKQEIRARVLTTLQSTLDSCE